MKKLALSLAVLFAVGMVSCGGNKEKECNDTCNADTMEVVAAEVTEVPADSAAADTTVAVEAAAEETPAEAPAN